MSINYAREADKEGNVTKAIELYENTIRNGSAEFIDYVNLICIYFDCMDFGFASANHISEEVETNCSTRALELIDEAESKFGPNDELTFWKNYIPFLGWGEEMGEMDLQGDSLVPYIFLARVDSSEGNIRKARHLYSELREIEGSHRKILLMSRLEAIFADLPK